MVSEGRFRDDLYFRLAVVRLAIPSLRERKEDIPYLVEHFVGRFNVKRNKNISGVTPAVMEILMRHDFPGNVRELENIIEYGFVLCHEPLIDVNLLPDDVHAQGRSTAKPAPEAPLLKLAEADTIRLALVQTRGHLEKTAKELGISRTTLWRKMGQHKISAREFRKPILDK